MTLGFNTHGNNQTSGRNSAAVLSGKLRNTIGSTTHVFKYCNRQPYSMNLFNTFYETNNTFEPYHILNGEGMSLDKLQMEESEDDSETTTIKTKSFLMGFFTPKQIRTVYSVPSIAPLSRIRRPIVTIITAFSNPYLVNDVKTFGRVFGLPPCNLTVRNFSRRFVTPWAVETTLNVQWVYAMNPYAQIRVIQAASNSWNDIFKAINFANNKNNFNPRIDTDIVTMSFGSMDNGIFKSFERYFTNPNTIYFAASGNSNTVSFPSSCSNVIAVGGTSLQLNSSNFTRALETSWSKTGSGFSPSFTKPFYQPSLLQNNQRTTPDVSCVADSNTGCCVIINGRAYSIGGTSLASPIYAGMMSTLIQRRLNNRKSTYTSVLNRANTIQPLLYNNSNSFFDVVNGSSGQYFAGVGFDIPSGLGVLNCNDIVAKLG